MASKTYEKSLKKQELIRQEAENLNRKLLEDFFDMEEEERKSKVLELMMDWYIINTGKALEKKRKKRAEEAVKRGLYNYNVDTKEKGEDGMTEYDRLKAKYPERFKDAIQKIINKDKDKRYEDFDAIMEAENYREAFNAYYLDELEANPAVRDVLNAHSTDELDQALIALETKTAGGFESITTSSMQNAAEELNAEHYKEYKSAEEKTIGNLVSELNTTEWKEDVEKYTLSDLHPEALKKNAAFIHELYDGISGVDYLTSSPNFRNMKKELVNLVKMADAMAAKKKFVSQRERTEYAKQTEKVLSLANVYLENKKDASSRYAQDRVKQVRDLRRKLKTNIHQNGIIYNSINIEVMDWASGDMFANINRYDAIGFRNRHLFLGKHTPGEVERSGSRFSLGRSAGYSISVFVMLNMGYKAEDILDKKKLHAEKAKVFDEVFKRCVRFNEEDKDWIAKQMYDGFKKADAFQDEALKKIDFTKEDVIKDKYFAMMNGMSAVIFDIYQERAYVEEQTEKLYREDQTLPNKTAENFYLYRRDRRGILGYLNNTLFKMTESYAQLKLDPVLPPEVNFEFINNAVKSRYYMNLLKEVQQKGLSYTEASAAEDSNMDYFLKTSVDYLGDYNTAFSAVPKESSVIADKIMNLSIFKDIKIDLNNKEQIFSNMPQPADIKRVAADVAFEKKALKTIKHFQNDTFDDVDSVNRYAKDAATIAVYEIFKSTGKHFADPKTNGPMDLNKAAKILSTNNVFLKMIKQKNGKGFRNPHVVLEDLRNPDKLVKLMNALHGKKAVAEPKNEMMK